jgi:hypothetical protein
MRIPIAAAPQVRFLRGRVAALSRGVRAGERTQAELDEARAALGAATEAARIQFCIEALTTRASQLTDAQRIALADLISA